ncbi:MAG: choline ABC transporter permease, partial [Gordonia sp. (in: high G+C Gram-positive bacteria)]
VMLDGMQTIPVFVYLIPVALLFGPGNTAAFVATVVYAIPPTARLTELGIRTAAPQVTEAASSLGMTRRQLLVKVQLPLSRAHILAGVNQTVMAAMAMAIIAAMIGAAGLGQPVWRSLGRLEFGAALEGGLALVFMAVILDRVSASVGAEGRSRSMAQRVGFVAPVILSVLAALSVPSLRTLSFTDPPELMQASLRIGVDRILTWLNLTMGEVFDLIADTVVRFALAPLTDVLVWIPWPIVLLVGFVVGHVANGWRGGLLVVGGLTGIGLLGGWAAAAETVSIVGVAVAMAILFGVPLGVLMSQSDNLARLLRPVLDIMQTLPIFLFVLPAVIIFGAGSMAGVLAPVVHGDLRIAG